MHPLNQPPLQPNPPLYRGPIAHRRRHDNVVPRLEPPPRRHVRAEPDVREPQQRRRVERHRTPREPIAAKEPALRLRGGAHLVAVLEARLPHAERARRVLDVLGPEGPRAARARGRGEGGLLEEVDVLEESMDENVVAQRGDVARYGGGRTAEKPGEGRVDGEVGGWERLSAFLPLPRSLGLPEPRRLREVKVELGGEQQRWRAVRYAAGV